MTHRNRAFSNKLAQISIDPENVISCMKVKVVNGNMIAIPFKVPEFVERKQKFNHVSVSHSDYCKQKITHCGDPHKPLIKYNMNACRNRLLKSEGSRPSRNISNVDFGKKYPRQFLTSNQNMFRGESGIQSSIHSIVASKVAAYHKQQSR